jgi:hypothetical protein
VVIGATGQAKRFGHPNQISDAAELPVRMAAVFLPGKVDPSTL